MRLMVFYSKDQERSLVDEEKHYFHTGEMYFGEEIEDAAEPDNDFPAEEGNDATSMDDYGEL